MVAAAKDTVIASAQKSKLHARKRSRVDHSKIVSGYSEKTPTQFIACDRTNRDEAPRAIVSD